MPVREQEEIIVSDGGKYSVVSLYRTCLTL